MSGSPACSGAIHTERSPFHFFERTSSANLQSRSAVNAGNEQNIRDFVYFKKRDPVTGAVSKVESGHFMNDSDMHACIPRFRDGLGELQPFTNVLEQVCPRHLLPSFT